jgi:hypothetical protein
MLFMQRSCPRGSKVCIDYSFVCRYIKITVICADVHEANCYSVDEKEPLSRLLSKLIEWLEFEIDKEVGKGKGKLDSQDFYRIQALVA